MRTPRFLAAIVLGGLAWAAGDAAAAAGERTGEEIVKAQCATCHAKGLHGAPRIDDREAWIPRLKNGLDATVRSAIRGHGDMPARGGLANLTDSELRSAVLYLFNPAGPPKPPPPAATPGPNQRIVDGMEVYLGMKPVRAGIYHLNVTLRDAKTHAVIEDAQVEATLTNPVMGTESSKLEQDAAGKGSYHADVRVSGREPHVITVQIRRKGSTRLTETKFDFKG
jgi:cytochrome c5